MRLFLPAHTHLDAPARGELHEEDGGQGAQDVVAANDKAFHHELLPGLRVEEGGLARPLEHWGGVVDVGSGGPRH